MFFLGIVLLVLIGPFEVYEYEIVDPRINRQFNTPIDNGGSGPWAQKSWYDLWGERVRAWRVTPTEANNAIVAWHEVVDFSGALYCEDVAAPRYGLAWYVTDAASPRDWVFPSSFLVLNLIRTLDVVLIPVVCSMLSLGIVRIMSAIAIRRRDQSFTLEQVRIMRSALLASIVGCVQLILRIIWVLAIVKVIPLIISPNSTIGYYSWGAYWGFPSYSWYFVILVGVGIPWLVITRTVKADATGIFIWNRWICIVLIVVFGVITPLLMVNPALFAIEGFLQSLSLAN